jgi:hypothetical protein
VGKLLFLKKRSRLEIIKKVLRDREKLILDSLKKSRRIKISSLRKLTEILNIVFNYFLYV